MSDETPAEKVLDWKQIGALLSVGASAGFSPEALFKAWIAAKLESQGGTQSLVWNTAVESAVLAGETLHKIEEPFLPLFASFVAPILSALFGADFDEGEFSKRDGTGRRQPRRHLPSWKGSCARSSATPPPRLCQPTPARSGSRPPPSRRNSKVNSTPLVPDLLSHLLPFDVGHFEGLLSDTGKHYPRRRRRGT
jgi:hypothetical protein